MILVPGGVHMEEFNMEKIFEGLAAGTLSPARLGVPEAENPARAIVELQRRERERADEDDILVYLGVVEEIFG